MVESRNAAGEWVRELPDGGDDAALVAVGAAAGGGGDGDSDAADGGSSDGDGGGDGDGDGDGDDGTAVDESWREEIKENDRIDAKDGDGDWYEAEVRRLRTTKAGKNQWLVHFRGWSDRWNVWVERNSQDVAPRFTKVRPEAATHPPTPH